MGKTAPLSGIRVLDLTAFVSGTTCTEQLAWLGAEVLKVERPVKGEQARYSIAEPGVDTTDFCLLNMNKRSLTCDMKSPEGLEIIKKLVAKCDVFVENMSPGAIDRLGLSYDVCKEINPKLIYLQIKGFDMNGPCRDYPAFNSIAVAMGGLGARNGEKGGLPLVTGPADPASGHMAASAVLAALLLREKTGVGEKIQISMQEVIMALCSMDYFAYNRTKEAPKRCGNEMGTNKVAPHYVYKCAPGGENDYVQIYCSRHPGSTQFESLCRVIGREDLITDERMKTPFTRYDNKEYLNAVIEEWTSKRTKMEVTDIMCKAGVPCGAVLDSKDLANDEYLLKSGAIIETQHPTKGVLRQPGYVPKMSGFMPEYKNSPALGEGDEEIYTELLGMSKEELEKLRVNKVI